MSNELKHPEQAEGAQWEREAFEAWAAQRCVSITKAREAMVFANGRRVHVDGYIMADSELAWLAWKARAALAHPSPAINAATLAAALLENGVEISALFPSSLDTGKQPSPAPELVHCACGDAFPVNSYGAGLMDANNGVCQNCDAATVAQAGQVPDIDAMVSRFLSWRLPENFSPDCGISFTRINHPTSWPVGTNLFTAEQAKAMILHMLAAAPAQGGDA